MKTTTSQYFRQLTIITFAIMMMEIFFGIVILVVYSNRNPVAIEITPIIAYGICTFAFISAIGLSKVIFNQRLTGIRSETNLKKQLIAYKSAVILRYAILEMPGFAGILFYFLTGEIYLLGFTVLSALTIFIVRPIPEKLIQQLQVDFKTQQLLEDPNGELY